MIKIRITTLAALLALPMLVNADVLKLKDGSQLQGSLQKIHEGTVYYETSYAGVLEIQQSEVVGLETENPVYLKTDSGEVYKGEVRDSDDGVEVASSGGPVRTRMDNVTAGWQPGDEDPISSAEMAELEAQLRKWKYQAGVNISGSDGNTDESSSALDFQATLEGPQDRLNFYGSYEYGETDGVATRDELKGGVRYTNFFTEKWGWFMREELEIDDFEGIDFRSTTAAGMTYRFINEEKMHLEGSAGFSYRYDDYVTGESEDFPGLDFGVQYDWEFADWGMLVSGLDYVPSINDFGDYLLMHESGVDFPLGTSDMWRLRVGLAHEYNSSPVTGREKLDTSYFIRLLLNWE